MMLPLMPMRSDSRCISLAIEARPPAKRNTAWGWIMRKMATVSRISRPLSGSVFSSGVPEMGTSMLIGIDTGFTLLSVRANSTLWARLSPMPMMPPLHISMPVARAASMVLILSSMEWVEQRVEK